MSTNTYAVCIIILVVLAAAARWDIHLIIEKDTGKFLSFCIGGLVLVYTIITGLVCSMSASLIGGFGAGPTQVFFCIAVTFVLMNAAALFLIVMYVSSVRKR